MQLTEDVSVIGSASGVYTLILFLVEDVTLAVGKLGEHRFPSGYYTYTGSALGNCASSLKQRIARHLRREKRKFWHIDYLLANKNVSVEAVVAAETDEKMECILNGYLKSIMGAKVQVSGFGASDCRNGCGSHLLYFQDAENDNCLVSSLVEFLQSSSAVRLVNVVR